MVWIVDFRFLLEIMVDFVFYSTEAIFVYYCSKLVNSSKLAAQIASNRSHTCVTIIVS